MIPQTNKGAGSFFSGHDMLNAPLVPIPAEQVRAAALAVISRSASQEEAGTFLRMLGVGALEVDQGMFVDPSEGVA